MAGREDAQQAADALALALEEAGLDVGRAFPLLHAAIGRDGAPAVEIGHLAPAVAGQLADLIARAAAGGITVDVLRD
ncbi:hypothetical protein [Dactylosporangium sp. CA-092794]|uniref:hypothetical protein n=1 Tax=Dactylosporangium sp. CA-092794 TaxID=3239929 RepID=UPI003D8C98A0